MFSRSPYPFSEREEMLEFLPIGARTVLDVGCHSGGFGLLLRRQDPTRVLWAVERNPEAAAAARPNYDRVVVGTYPDALAASNERFDCVVFNDVLEHIVDPWATLRATAGHLVPGGTVIASIPNVRNIKVLFNLVVRGDWTYTETGILDRTHLRFFTARTIRSLFTDSGFVVERIEGIHSLGHVRFWFWRVFPMLLGHLAYTGFAVRARLASPSAERRTTTATTQGDIEPSTTVAGGPGRVSFL